MQIENSVALVTGAGRGLGAEWVRQLHERGARKIYAAVRDASRLQVPGAELIEIDVTDPAAVARAAATATDVTLLVNNAGIDSHTRFLDTDPALVRRQFETNFFGPLDLALAFAPVLRRNAGGAIVNVLSALAWFAVEGEGPYAASKAAAWSMTDALRLELASQNTQVSCVIVGAMNTDMATGYDGPKAAPEDVVRTSLDGIEAGSFEVLADAAAQRAKQGLGIGAEQRYPSLARAS
jgi:NAD(P)-dependent dehydrogenase (short-subunit alcohol dehydrogenase family)